METQPLILTLSIEADAFMYFNELRKQHFPPERNFLQAHLTLFHKLPAEEEEIENLLTEVSRNQNQINLEVTEPMLLGFGVAFRIVSDELQQLHSYLQKKWELFLSPQDRQKLRPHITIQNKVKPEIAKELATNLRTSFQPFTTKGTGFTLWKYQGGPWEFQKEFMFIQKNL